MPIDPDLGEQISLARRRLTALASVALDDYVQTWFSARVIGPALDLVVRHARGFSDGISHVMIEMPTQHGKTLHTCLMVAELLGQAPELHVQACGYGDDFLKQSTAYVSRIGAAEAWRDVFPNVSLGKPLDAGRAKHVSDNTVQIDTMRRMQVPGGKFAWKAAGGYFRARSVMGQVSGYPGDVMLMDDVYKGWDGDHGALSPTWNKKLLNFYGGVFRRRMQGARSCEVHAYTPWTDDDLRMHVLSTWEKKRVPYLHIRLPMHQRPDHKSERAELLHSTWALRGLARFMRMDEAVLRAAVEAGGPCRPYDLRPHNEALDLERPGKTQEWWDSERDSSTLRDYAALCDLAPRTDLTDRFPKSWWRLYDPIDVPPSDMESIKISVDPNGDTTVAGAFASVGVVGFRGHPDPDPAKFRWNFYVMAERRDRPGYSDFCDMVSKTVKEWPEVRDLIMERTGHGRSAATDSTFLQRPEIRRLKIDWREPSGDDGKSTRWDRMEVPLRTGRGHLPARPSACGRIDPDSWLHDRKDVSAEQVKTGDATGWLSEFAQCARGTYVDRVDMLSQLLDHQRDVGEKEDAWRRLGSLRLPGS